MFGVVEVGAVHEHLALDARAGDDLVHAVDGAEEGGLAATGRANERRHRIGLDRERHVLDGQEVAVEDVEVVDVDALGHVEVFSLAAGLGREVARDEARDEVERHDDEDENKRRRPCAHTR